MVKLITYLSFSVFLIGCNNIPSKTENLSSNTLIVDTLTKDVILDSTFAMNDDREFFVYFNGANNWETSEQLLSKYIIQNLKYPSIAKKHQIKGNVYVSFMIDSVGKVFNTKIEKSLNPDIDNEVIRVISEMPNWKWDKNIEERISVKKVLPIKFEIADK